MPAEKQCFKEWFLHSSTPSLSTVLDEDAVGPF